MQVTKPKYEFTECVTDEHILEAAAYVIAQKNMRQGILSCPADCAEFLRFKLALVEHEVFMMFLLDSQNRIIELVEMFRGTINGAAVYPREVVKTVLKFNAASVVISHNHPSGICEPSEADKLITNRLKQALALIDVSVLDHIVVGEQCYSFAEHGLL